MFDSVQQAIPTIQYARNLMRPTSRIRRSQGFRTVAKLCRQYLKWFGNASYKPERNGERWLLESLGQEAFRTVVDVGANVGSWALIAEQCFPQATIYALEPVPSTADALRTATAGHQRIQSFAVGLAAHTGTLTLNFHPSASSHATFTNYPHKLSGQPTECEVLRGDEFLSRQGVDYVDFLKLDVEGAEHLVLQGLADSLQKQRVRFIQFEYGRVNILTRFLLRDFYELFKSYGYIVGKIYPDYVDFRDYDLSDEDFLGPNYLACRANESMAGDLHGGQRGRRIL
jgi:FkbM family methyltransferase